MSAAKVRFHLRLNRLQANHSNLDIGGRKISLADKTGGPVWSQANIRERSDFHDMSVISIEGGH